MGTDVETAIVGAGPYGLAIAAHLCEAGGEAQVFGAPVEFWRTKTPLGMLLRSPLVASSIGDPAGKHSLQEYARDTGVTLSAPLPVETFVDYGLWFQRRAVPDVDPRGVTRIRCLARGFRLDLDDGSITARRVVVAAGVAAFGYRPPALSGLDDDLVSHTLDQRDLSRFAGRRVTVIGRGQSAVESAALLHEGGADVQLAIRAAQLRWLSHGARRHHTPRLSSLLYAPPDVGPMFVSQLVARPEQYARLPRPVHRRLDRRSVRPAAAGWLRERTAGIPVRSNVSVVEARPQVGRLRVRYSDGSRDLVDHLLLGTGYRVDLDKYLFLDPELRRAIATADGWPRLSAGFETTMPGLYLAGAPAVGRFGPLMRFVAGSDFCARSITRAIRR